MKFTFSQRIAHFFHVVSNIKPLVWIGLYVCAIPIFALIYWGLSEGQFRVPDGASTDYGAWFYYSIVTITTLGFGDYTPAHATAQAFTAIEVMYGLIIIGFFLNAVGAMKSEIDVESEIERQKALHEAMESEKLQKSVPMVLHSLNIFLAYCYAVTTPLKKRKEADTKYNPDFVFKDLSDMFKPSGIPIDNTRLPGVERLMQSASQTSIVLDSLQQRIDLTIWPELLEDCFSFVANYQMFSNTDIMFRNPDKIVLQDSNEAEAEAFKTLEKKIEDFQPEDGMVIDPDLRGVAELFNFIKENAATAIKIETLLTEFGISGLKK